MINNIVFVNYFHNGDIHFSRSFVKYTANLFNKKGYNCRYFHKNSPSLLNDINIKHDLICSLNSEKILSKQIGDTIYLSTWYGVESFRFMNTYGGTTFNCLYHIFEDHISKYIPEYLEQYQNEDKKLFFPEIDYSKFSINNIKSWILKDFRKKILISNGNTLSGQSENVNMDELIDTLSSKFPDILFIPTNATKIVKDNVIKSSEIIGPVIGNCDLNEVSFLSTFCDIIIGKCSGTYSFSMTRYNMFERDCTFVAFSNLGNDGSGALWYYDSDFSLDYKARVVFSNSGGNLNSMIQISTDEIRRIQNG